MKGFHQIFAEGTTLTLSGLILALALIAGLMIGCKEENSSKPTAPNIPIYPEGQTSENSNEMGFYSAKGDGQFGAFVNENSEFQISVPTGDFLLTYVTNTGTYYVAFRATKSAILFIGLLSGGQVFEASVQKGAITNESEKTWQSNSVTLFAWPGSAAAWKDVFKSDGSAAIALIKNQNVAPDVNKLPEPQPAPNPRPTVEPTLPPNTECIVSNADDSGEGTLRQILTNTDCPTITFAPGVTKIVLGGTELTVARDVNIDGGSGVIISGNQMSRVFYINNGVTVSLAGLTIADGRQIACDDTGFGGGIYNKGILTLKESTIVSNNVAHVAGGGVANFMMLTVHGVVSNNISHNGGGGIDNSGTLIINGIVNSNIAENGGGIFNNSGMLTINGTVNSNSAENGGGIYNHSGTLILETEHQIEGNHADANNIHTGNEIGGGIYTTGLCPNNVNYGNGNYRGSGTAIIDNCNGNP